MHSVLLQDYPKAFTVPTLFKVQVQRLLWPSRQMQLWIPENLKIKTKSYNSRIQWHRTLQARNGDIEKDKTRGSKSEPHAVSRGVLCQRVSAAVSGLQTTFLLQATWPVSLVFIWLQPTGFLEMFQVPGIFSRLDLTCKFYALQELTEGSSHSVIGCLAFQALLWGLGEFSKISYSRAFSMSEKPTPCSQSLSAQAADWGLQDKSHTGLRVTVRWVLGKF